MVNTLNNLYHKYHIFIFLESLEQTNDIFHAILKKKYKISLLDNNIGLLSQNKKHSLLMFSLEKELSIHHSDDAKTLFSHDVKEVMNLCNIHYNFILVTEALESAITL